MVLIANQESDLGIDDWHDVSPTGAEHGSIQGLNLIGGTLSGSYLVKRLLGLGPSASTYLVEDIEAPGEHYAAKILHALTREMNLSISPNRLSAVLRLDHPNIVKVYGYYSDAGVGYRLAEYVNGMSLSWILHHRIALTAEQAFWITRQVITALEYAGRQGIMVHANLKPENILIGANGYVKVCDFNEDIAETSSSDVYSLCRLIAAMLTGLPSGAAYIESPIDWRVHEGECLVPKQIEQLITQGPGFQTLAELAAAIDAVYC